MAAPNCTDATLVTASARAGCAVEVDATGRTLATGAGRGRKCLRRQHLCLRDHERRVELRHLQALVALTEEGTFTDAAIRLGVTQSAVSRTIVGLETASAPSWCAARPAPSR